MSSTSVCVRRGLARRSRGAISCGRQANISRPIGELQVWKSKESRQTEQTDLAHRRKCIAIALCSLETGTASHRSHTAHRIQRTLQLRIRRLFHWYNYPLPASTDSGASAMSIEPTITFKAGLCDFDVSYHLTRKRRRPSYGSQPII